MKLLSRLFRSEKKERVTVNLLVTEYVSRLRSGELVDRSTFISNYPHLAVDLSKAMASNPAVLALEDQVRRTRSSSQSAQRDPMSGSDVRLRDDRTPTQFIKPLDINFGEYEIFYEIGQGAMGRVYKAREKGTGRFVALKTLQAGAEIRAAQLRRLSREGFVHGQLNHPNIVQVYDAGMCEDVPYLAMELIKGGRTLETLLEKTGKPVEERRAAEIICAVARALAYSHDQNVVHRDIKPSNIMMVGDTPKLTDFGLAFVHQEEFARLTQSGEMLGTLCYMPPEQVRGRVRSPDDKPLPQIDVYSLGATFYELLTGEPPFTADSPVKVIKKVIEDDPSPPSASGVSKEVEAICIQCLEKMPEDRYSTASELADDLQCYLDGKPVSAPAVNWMLRRVQRTISRRHLIAIALTLTGVVLFVVACLVYLLLFRGS